MLDLAAYVKETAPKLKSISDDPEELIQTLISLNVSRAHSDTSVAEFVGDVLETLEESDLVNSSNKEDAQVRLSKLLSVASLGVTAKALHLQLDHERLLSYVRILTDARPVYGTNVNAAPDAVLITHTLKLSYYQDGKPIDIYIAIDSDDIANFEQVIERAKSKATSLSKIFESSKIRVVHS